MINKTITHLSLRAAALLTLMLLTILTVPTEAKAQGGDSYDTYTLTLDDNYDGGGIRTFNIYSGYNITPTAPTRTDYTFLGWATSATGDVVYAPNVQITINGDLTLYAKWVKTTCHVYLYANDGTETMVTDNIAGGTNYNIPTCGFTRSDYFFIGWATSASGNVVYQPGQTVTLTDDLTLYAKWFEGYAGTCGWVNGPSGLDGSEVTWSLTKSEGGTIPDLLTISSSIPNGSMENYGEGGSPWYNYRNQIKTIVIGDGMNHIGGYAFKDCTKAISVSFGNRVKDIGEKAFQGCTSLTSVNIPLGVGNIFEQTFDGCTSLTSVNIPSSVTIIQYRAFSGCTSLTSVNIPSSVTKIQDRAFYGCTGLRSVTIGSGVTNIRGQAFDNCLNLSSVTIYATSVPTCDLDVFISHAFWRKIYVPATSVEVYRAADGWKEYASDILPLDVIIADGDDKSVLTNGQTKNIALKRTFPAGKKQTVCLPFDPSELLNHGKVWEFTGISEEGGVKKAVMTEVTSGPLSANTPYIFEATSNVYGITFPNVEVNISEYPETVDATAGFTFHGTYTKLHWDANDDDVKNGHIYGFLMEDSEDDPSRKEGMFVKAKYNTNVRPFSCYLEYNGELTGTETASTARRKASAEELPDVIEIEWKSAEEAPGMATGIVDIEHGTWNSEHSAGTWYSLDGRRLSGKPSVKGLYIHNGKKVVIK
ncbi:MAG: leucine-rich repeat protein [Prevotella sp.]|nr:leucine-rich repeat protein [Prevotella sp.]